MFETRLQTYWDDADPAGLVYYAHFFGSWNTPRQSCFALPEWRE